ncbi:hypothetical protein SNE40_016843 [Patella caerulea]|uniref:Citrate transporter-like domain-containing protein n=1 Tax=Patella caerulea TaxID=87958 RepID=A0AAN8JF25_PATCE
MPSKRKSSGSLTLHVNPNHDRRPSVRRLLSSQDSDYGSTSRTDGDGRSVGRSYSYCPESKKNIILSNSDIDPPTPSPSTPLDDVFLPVDPEKQLLENSTEQSTETTFSITSIDKHLRNWANFRDVNKLDMKQILVLVKTGILFIFLIICTGYIASNPEVTEEKTHVTVAKNRPYDSGLETMNSNSYPLIKLKLDGPFDEEAVNHTFVNSSMIYVNIGGNETRATPWKLDVNIQNLREGRIIQKEKQLECKIKNCSLSIRTNNERPVPLEYSYLLITAQANNGVYYATVILILVYILIIFELVHRTVAALLGSYAAIAVLAAIHERPTQDIIIGWIDMETIMLLFGMMMLVSIFAETGFFDYSAVKVYQIAKGEVWPLVTLLCLFSAVVSAFLDNVTTILLLTPVTIRLCQVLNLDPKQILMAEVVFSNIGGTATAVGDPPNVIIVGATSKMGISFTIFTIHMLIGIIPVILGAYGLLRFYYRKTETLKNKDSPEVIELKHEIGLWKRAAARISVATREESVMKVLFLQKSVELENILSRKLHKQSKDKIKDFKDTLQELKKRYYITDPVLLVESGFVLLVVILVLFLHSFVPTLYVVIGWVAVTGAVWLLVLANISDIESILHKIEWSTLLFFAALFILMEALTELGLIDVIGSMISDIIKSVEPESRMIASISIILWISALASSFIDNIPYTTALVPVLINISQDTELDLPLLPLIIALAFGACLGGNGTLIGASANVVCAGIAEQHGYGINFCEFFKVGFPMMLLTTAISHVYLIICHVWIGWNS